MTQLMCDDGLKLGGGDRGTDKDVRASDSDKRLTVERVCGTAKTCGTGQSTITNPGKGGGGCVQIDINVVRSVGSSGGGGARGEEADVRRWIVCPGGTRGGKRRRRAVRHRVLREDVHGVANLPILPANGEARSAAGEQAV